MAPDNQSPDDPLRHFGAQANRVHDLGNLLAVMAGCVEAITKAMPGGTADTEGVGTQVHVCLPLALQAAKCDFKM
jgi:hypothetical protein